MLQARIINGAKISGQRSDEKQDVCIVSQSRSISPKILISKDKVVTLQWETWLISLQASDQSAKRQ